MIESSPMGDMSKTEGFHGFPSQKKSRIPLRVKAQNATGNKDDDEGTTGLVTNAFFSVDLVLVKLRETDFMSHPILLYLFITLNRKNICMTKLGPQQHK